MQKVAARAKRLRNLQPPALATAAAAREIIDTAYASEKEPWGRAWAPLKYRKPPPPPLQLTGLSRGSIKVTAWKGQVRFVVADYLYHHMAGFTTWQGAKVPKRNPTPFRLNKQSGMWGAKPQFMKLHQRNIKKWVETGVVP